MSELEARLHILAAGLADNGRGVCTLIHAQDPEPIAELVRAKFSNMKIVTCPDYPGLDGSMRTHKPDICLSYRFGDNYPREALFAGDPVYVHVAGTGSDHLVPWNTASTIVCNSSGFQADLMADYALAAIYTFNLKLKEFGKQQDARLWKPLSLRGAKGQRATILGTGPIGQAIAGKLASVGLEVTGINSRGKSTPPFDSVLQVANLDTVLPGTDHLVISLPRTEQTLGLLSGPMLDLLPVGATVINLARGGILDEAALLDRLRSGHLRGAALDVFETEPLTAEHPLWSAPNTIITPHSSALFDGWETAAANRFLDNLSRLAQGRALENRIDPDRGY